MSKETLSPSAPFWEMAELAMNGNLASCQSCVEFWYFQSKQNALAFLDSCAAGGLVERMSLLDLHGELESISVDGPTLRQKWYDQAIYISAPTFRKQNLDAAREKVEGTKNAVFEAFHLYFEILNADDRAIDIAYIQAIKQQKLRRSAFAKDRMNVDLSTVAKLRLIKDGFRNSIKKGNAHLSGSQVQTLATTQTIEFIQAHSDEAPVSVEVCDYSQELTQFIVEFFGSRERLPAFWQERDGERFHFWLFPVVDELIRQRVLSLRLQDDDQELEVFVKTIQDSLESAKRREKKNTTYLAALDEVVEDFKSSFSTVVVSNQFPQPVLEHRI